jgi:uncharacterized protein YceK
MHHSTPAKPTASPWTRQAADNDERSCKSADPAFRDPGPFSARANRLPGRFIAVAICVALGGCSTIREAYVGEDSNTLSGAGSIVTKPSKRTLNSDTEQFELVDIEMLLKQYGFDDPKTLEMDTKDESKSFKYRRNDLQQQIIAASNQKCGTYIRRIVESKANTKTFWSSLGLLFSGAASVVGHAATAKVFAASSTAVTGVESTFNEARFSNLAVNIIATGIAKRREAILSGITGKADSSLVSYPVSAAVADAVAYHSACNIVSGLETAAEATKLANVSNVSK